MDIDFFYAFLPVTAVAGDILCFLFVHPSILSGFLKFGTYVHFDSNQDFIH